MRIYDENNVEIENPNFELGFLKDDKRLIAHHEAIEAVEEQFHYEYTTYPNGGRDRRKVIDVEAVAAAEAWDEYEEIYRYIPYTADELAQIAAEREEAYRNSPEYRIAELEAALELLLSGVTE